MTFTHYKKSFFLALFTVIINFAAIHAQSEYSAFTATGAGTATTTTHDYQCIGINPSNLGWEEKKKVHIGFVEFGASAFSPALSRQDIRTFLNQTIKGEERAITPADKRKFAKAFADDGSALNIDVNWVGVAVQLPKFGGLAFSVRERVSGNLKTNPTLSDLLFNGRDAAYFDKDTIEGNDTFGVASNPKTVGEITNGTNLKFNWVREYNVAYGRQIYSTDIMKYYVGVGLKYLQGYAFLDFEANGNSLVANAAITPQYADIFTLKSGNVLASEGGFIPAGSGFGIDLGGSVLFKEKWMFGASITNLGEMKWTSNVIALDNDTLYRVKSKGLNSYNTFSNENGLGKGAGLQWRRNQKYSTGLPTAIRFGGSYKPIKWFTGSADLIIPAGTQPGNIKNVQGGVGGRFTLVRFINLSTGINVGGGYAFNVPLGVVFSPSRGAWEFGIASRDVLSFLINESPNLSLAAGFARFGF